MDKKLQMKSHKKRARISVMHKMPDVCGKEIVDSNLPREVTDEVYICEPISRVPNDLSEGSFLAVKSVNRPSVLERLETRIDSLQMANFQLESKMQSLEVKLKELGRETAILKLNRTKNEVVQVGYALQESVIRDQLSMKLAGAHTRSPALNIHQRDMVFKKIVQVLPVQLLEILKKDPRFDDINSKTSENDDLTSLVESRNVSTHPAFVDVDEIQKSLDALSENATISLRLKCRKLRT